MTNPLKIAILGTGGTIAGRAASASDNLGYTAAQIGVEQLVGAIDALQELSQAGGLLTEQVTQLDSKDMAFAVWIQLAERVDAYLQRDDVQGVVITHGTDTLEETAYFLQRVLNPAKPVVLTCAMRPATSLAPDGPQNVMDAVSIAQYAGASGVMVVCAGVIHSALDVQKVHTYQLDAFSSGDAGAVGYAEDGKLRLVRNWPLVTVSIGSIAMNNVAKYNLTSLLPGTAWPAVEIVMNVAGASGTVVNALVASGVRGLVAAGTGNGTLHHALEAALLQAQSAGVKVVRATRCLNGKVLPKAGDVLPDSGGLSPVKARVEMMLSLMQRA